jgi:hypothetical protein
MTDTLYRIETRTAIGRLGVTGAVATERRFSEFEAFHAAVIAPLTRAQKLPPIGVLWLISRSFLTLFSHISLIFAQQSYQRRAWTRGPRRTTQRCDWQFSVFFWCFPVIFRAFWADFRFKWRRWSTRVA